MKKFIFTFLSLCILYAQSNAQYCGNSGDTICTPTGQLSKPGLLPLATQLAPVLNGTTCSVTIQFQNFDTITFQGTTIHVNSLTVDKISNLPGNACWATNKPNNTFATNENGCIAVTFDSLAALPGQYQLGIYVTASTQELGNLTDLSASAAGLFYYVRVINDGGVIPALDTVGQAAGTADTIQTYGLPIVGGPGIGCDSTVLDSTYNYYVDTLFTSVKNIASEVKGLAVSPNPFNQKAIVTFNSAVTGAMTEKLTDVLGRTIWTRPMQVLIGANQSKIDRSSLPSGIYFYSIGDSRSTVNQKIIITE